jgi:hypothetical protein
VHLDVFDVVLYSQVYATQLLVVFNFSIGVILV